jgi:hypothetical protein
MSIRGIGLALTSDVTVAIQPRSQTVREGGRVTFSCVAHGQPPLTYQWLGDDNPIVGATNRILSYNPVVQGAQPRNIKVMVSNDTGSVTSQNAVLTLVPDNQPIVASGYNLVGFAGTPLVLPLSALIQQASDPDGDPITVAGFDSTGSNTASPAEITLTDAFLTYSNKVDFTGTDRFNVTLTDGLGGDATVTVNVSVQPLTGPQLSISHGSQGTVRLTWPATATTQGFRLVSADRVDAPTTNAVPGIALTEGDQSVLNLTPTTSTQFYRLVYP